MKAGVTRASGGFGSDETVQMKWDGVSTTISGFLSPMLTFHCSKKSESVCHRHLEQTAILTGLSASLRGRKTGPDARGGLTQKQMEEQRD